MPNIALTTTAHANQRRQRGRARKRLSRADRSCTTELDRQAGHVLDSHHGSAAPMAKPTAPPKRLPDCWECPVCGWWNFSCNRDTKTQVSHCFRSRDCGAARGKGCLQWKNASTEQKAMQQGSKAALAAGAAGAAGGAAALPKAPSVSKVHNKPRAANAAVSPPGCRALPPLCVV